VPNPVGLDDTEDWLTINQVAEIFCKHRTTVEKMIREGTLAAVKVGSGRGQYRILRRDLIELLNRNHRRAG
jgi:excisionase family DNA binding protein